MKLKLTLLIVIFTNSLIFSQVNSQGGSVWMAKEFSKEIALYYSKSYLFKNILGSTPEVEKFSIIPLAAASSGELTTLIYRCENKLLDGLILGFYGNYWNDAGVAYQGFCFKNLNKDQAIEFLNKIQTAINVNTKYLSEDTDNNNIFFKYDDIDVLIWANPTAYSIRLFWNGFDSSWEQTAFERTKKRFVYFTQK